MRDKKNNKSSNRVTFSGEPRVITKIILECQRKGRDGRVATCPCNLYQRELQILQLMMRDLHPRLMHPLHRPDAIDRLPVLVHFIGALSRKLRQHRQRDILLDPGQHLCFCGIHPLRLLPAHRRRWRLILVLRDPHQRQHKDLHRQAVEIQPPHHPRIRTFEDIIYQRHHRAPGNTIMEIEQAWFPGPHLLQKFR